MDILAVINEEVKEIFSSIVDDPSLPLEVLESEVRQASQELGRKVLEACLSQRTIQTDSPSEVCPVCQGELRRFRKRQRCVETLCGGVRVSRWVYRCDACSHYHVPWDTDEGLKGRFHGQCCQSDVSSLGTLGL